MQQAGKLPEAGAIYTEILRIDPQNFDALYLLGFVNLQRGQFAEAERLMAAATNINPSFPDAHFNRGLALSKLGRYQDALSCFDRLLAIRPNTVGALLERGTALCELMRYEDALATFDKALALAPTNAEGWHKRGEVLSALGRSGDALLSYDRCLAINPRSIPTLRRRAGALFDLNRFQETRAEYEKMLSIDPDARYVRGRLIFDALYCCDWHGLRQHRAQLVEALQSGKAVVTPGENIAISRSPIDQLQCARIWSANECPPTTNPLWRGEQYRHERIRVAYISGDFRAHAVAFLITGVFEHHDKTCFETVGISFGADDESDIRRRIERALDSFIDVRDKTNAEIASMLRRMEVDIAVDLMGFTGTSRPGIFAFRPAPVQVNYLGYPGTMGADYIDYLLADRILIPRQEEIYYSEKIVTLPDCYQANDSQRVIAEPAPTRAEAGLPDRGMVFCCFHNGFKILPEMFDIWMRILRAVEGSVLWLLDLNPFVTANLRREAAARGVAPERLLFAPRLPVANHLARHRLADLFLDTLPYNGHTTASDALWVGLPVLTCVGSTFAGRVGASLLTAVGLPELIASSLEEYEALALELAGNPTMLTDLRAKLARNREKYPLFDTPRFTRHIETAYRQIVERSRRGLPPESFDVLAPSD
jgi:predicted O-linked N-acetylglucosamine transferase (SPINDLY family)